MMTAGLTNFYRNYGAKCAIVVIAFDMLKAVGAVCLGGYFLGHLLGWGVIGKYFGALFCIIGHMFPVFYGFKGGKGVATGIGVILAVNPILGLMLLVIFAVVVAITRYVSLGSCIAAFVMPALAIVLVPDFFWFAVIIAAIIIIKHRANLARIVRGEESKLSFSK